MKPKLSTSSLSKGYGLSLSEGETLGTKSFTHEHRHTFNWMCGNLFTWEKLGDQSTDRNTPKCALVKSGHLSYSSFILTGAWFYKGKIVDTHLFPLDCSHTHAKNTQLFFSSGASRQAALPGRARWRTTRTARPQGWFRSTSITPPQAVTNSILPSSNLNNRNFSPGSSWTRVEPGTRYLKVLRWCLPSVGEIVEGMSGPWKTAS